MIQKINQIIVAQSNGTTDSENIYVIDYKNINGGEVEVLESEPADKFVHLTNENRVCVCYVAFKENALKVSTPEAQVKQCECVLFPAAFDTDDWVLFIETKYANNFRSAFSGEIDHPNTSINQIISTVEYFREKEILPRGKRVFAMVSFPKLIEPFSEAFLTRSHLTLEKILIDYRILLRPTNTGTIKSRTRIRI